MGSEMRFLRKNKKLDQIPIFYSFKNPTTI